MVEPLTERSIGNYAVVKDNQGMQLNLVEFNGQVSGPAVIFQKVEEISLVALFDRRCLHFRGFKHRKN